MTVFSPTTPTADQVERFAALMPSGETDWAERGHSIARSILLAQANRLEEIASTDDLTLYRLSKEDDAAYAAFRQYFSDNLPGILIHAKAGVHGEAMLDYLHGDTSERNEQLLGAALLLKQLAEQPMNSATLEAADACLKMLPPAVRI
jgi:hypothetical protein